MEEAKTVKLENGAQQPQNCVIVGYNGTKHPQNLVLVG
jgi:hypothetical protein